MNDQPERLLLERTSYRRRRIADAGRALPFLGVLLWMLPLVWSGQDARGVLMSSASIYLFAVWTLLIGLGLILSRIQRANEQDDEPLATVKGSDT